MIVYLIASTLASGTNDLDEEAEIHVRAFVGSESLPSMCWWHLHEHFFIISWAVYLPTDPTGFGSFIESERNNLQKPLAINVIGTAISNNEENIFDLSNQRLQIKHENQFLFR